MKIKYLIAFLLFTLTVYGFEPLPKNFQKEITLSFSQTVSATTPDGETFPHTLDLTLSHHLKVNTIERNGNAHAQIRLKQIILKENCPYGSLDIDTNRKETHPLGMALKKIVDKPIKMIFDRQGNILAVKGFDEAIVQTLEEISGELKSEIDRQIALATDSKLIEALKMSRSLIDIKQQQLSSQLQKQFGDEPFKKIHQFLFPTLTKKEISHRDMWEHEIDLPFQKFKVMAIWELSEKQGKNLLFTIQGNGLGIIWEKNHPDFPDGTLMLRATYCGSALLDKKTLWPEHLSTVLKLDGKVTYPTDPPQSYPVNIVQKFSLSSK